MENILKFLNSQFISAFFGGLIGGLFTYLGVRKTIENEQKKIQDAEKSEVRAFCKAIQTELECILKRYLSSIGDTLGLHKKDQPFNGYYNVSEDYFTVFNSNAHLLGKIADDSLREQIVMVYTNTKGHLDSLRLNNGLLISFEQSFEKFIKTRDKADETKKNNNIDQLKSYGNVLLESHSSLVPQIESLIRELKKVH